MILVHTRNTAVSYPPLRPRLKVVKRVPTLVYDLIPPWSTRGAF